jgi:amino acid transporter
MKLGTAIFGRPLRSQDAGHEQINPAEGVPVLGLDALASASYGPEAALTVFLLAGASGSSVVFPISLCIVALLSLIYLSYRQTIAAYPQGGGSFTVARENLTPTAAQVAAAALAIDYILNAAVAISAGVAAIVSAIPGLLPHTLPLCLAVLALLTLINLRGIRSAGLIFMAPTYAFVASLGLAIVIGLFKVATSTAPPVPVAPLPHAPILVAPIGLWLVLRAFASGCTAMTGVEAVSNGVPLFREPRVRLATRTLTAIVAVLTFFLLGLALLVRAYGITATMPGEPGYQSVISQVVTAVVGRGVFYYVTMTTVLVVLALSANTSFADFPRVCRVLADDHYLPAELARRGSRLVFTNGIIVLAVLSGVLLVAFGGVTDHLIPLFAIGALLAFTMSQLGMVAHWRRSPGPGRQLKLAINGAGALATAMALGIVLVSKFTQGAWITVLVIPGLVLLFRSVKRYNDRLAALTETAEPLDLSDRTPPIVVIPLRRLDRVGHKALRFAVSITPDVYVIQVLAEELDTDDLERRWHDAIEEPARRSGHTTAPRLVVLRSPYRQFYERLLGWVHQFTESTPDRHIIVLIPELVQRRWYQFLVSHRALRLKAWLLLHGGPRVSVMSSPWYPDAVDGSTGDAPQSAPARHEATGRRRVDVADADVTRRDHELADGRGRDFEPGIVVQRHPGAPQ